MSNCLYLRLMTEQKQWNSIGKRFFNSYVVVAHFPDEKNVFLMSSSKEVDTWFLMRSPWPIISIIAFYLLFVTKLGPNVMKKRKPFNIKPILLLYNLYQCICNAYIVSTVFTTTGALSYMWNHSCHPMDPSTNPLLSALNHSSWWYFFSKVMDLLDTIFFILRKKQSHVTFLHVYHHANMAVSSWIYLKFIKGEQGAIVGVLNSSVHVIMYTYYFLAALGPNIQKYLWWKKYITKIQMLQFIILITYMATLLIKNCQLPKLFTAFVILQGIVFLVLFTNFYVKTYVMEQKSKTSNLNEISHQPLRLK